LVWKTGTDGQGVEDGHKEMSHLQSNCWRVTETGDQELSYYHIVFFYIRKATSFSLENLLFEAFLLCRGNSVIIVIKEGLMGTISSSLF
jgi:hypothetical protein